MRAGRFIPSPEAAVFWQKGCYPSHGGGPSFWMRGNQCIYMLARRLVGRAQHPT